MGSLSGQTLRRAGILIEGVSMLGILSARRGNDAIWQQTGLDPNIALPVAFGIGFAVWIAGTVRIRQERQLAKTKLREREF